MPTSTFTKLAQNLPMDLQGLLVGARAVDLGRQDAIAEKLLADYVAKTKDLTTGGEPKPTDQQLGEVTTEAGKDGLFKSIEQQAIDYQTQVNSVLEKRQRQAELYQSTIQELSKLDSPEAQRIAEKLGVTFSETDKQLSAQLDALQNIQQYRTNLYNTEVKKLDIKVKQVALTDALQDIEAKGLAVEWLPKLNGMLTIAYDSATGELKDKDVVDNFFKEFSAQTKGMDKQTVGRAYMILDEYVSKKVKNFREITAGTLNSVKEKMKKINKDNVEFFQGLDDLKNISAYADKYLSGADGQYARQEYIETATRLHEQGSITDNQFQNILSRAKTGAIDFFYDPRVIQSMEDPNMQKIAQEMYDMFVNKDSERSYWSALDSFAKRLNLNSYLDLNHTVTYYLPTVNPETFEYKPVPIKLYQGDPKKGTNSGIILYGFNPFNPNANPRYDEVVGEAMQKASKVPDNAKKKKEPDNLFTRNLENLGVIKKKAEAKVKGTKKSFGGSVPPENYGETDYGELTKGDSQLIEKGMKSDYKPMIEKVAKNIGIDDTLIFSMVSQESAFRHNVSSNKGAQGLMQITPIAYREAKRLKFIPQKTTWEEVKKDPELNLRIGAKYIKWLIGKYKGDLEKALGAYNWGPTNVDKKGLEKAPKETKNYIKNILRRHYGLRRKKEVSTRNANIQLNNEIAIQDKTRVK